MAGGAGLVCPGRRLRGEVADVDQIAVHLPRHLCLFFRCTGDVQVALVDLRNGFADQLQRIARRIGQAQRGASTVSTENTLKPITSAAIKANPRNARGAMFMFLIDMDDLSGRPLLRRVLLLTFASLSAAR